MKDRVGVLLPGFAGAIASTVIAGCHLMKKGLVPRYGIITEGEQFKGLPMAPTDEMVFGGWDLTRTDMYEAALHHNVLQRHLLDKIEPELRASKPWPGVLSEKFLAGAHGGNIVPAKNYRDELRIMREQVEAFVKQHKPDRMVMVNLISTERFCQVEDVHQTIEAFEAGLDQDDPRISPSMKYLYLAITMGIPHVNFTPSLSNVPALEDLAKKRGVPVAGEDGKTGQTMMKTVLAPAFLVRGLMVDGWYSTNILGNNDGAVLADPGANKTKVVSKLNALDSILGYHVADHQVHIHYYRPRGDNKEAWDNIDLLGWAGESMQMKVNFLCKDSILAAPLVIDLARLMDAAKRAGDKGVQRQMSVFFKSPYKTGAIPVQHDLFEQYRLLKEWVAKVGPVLRDAEGVASPARVG